MWEELRLITSFTTCWYLYPVQTYSQQSNSKIVVKRTEFWKFFALPNFKVVVPPKSCTWVISPPHITWKSFIRLLPPAPIYWSPINLMFRIDRRSTVFRFSMHFRSPITWSAISWSAVNWAYFVPIWLADSDLNLRCCAKLPSMHCEWTP